MGREAAPPVSRHAAGSDRILFGWLLLASLLGPTLGVPFAVALLPHHDPLRLWLGACIEFLFLLAPASAVGVWLGPRVGLGPRLLREFVLRTPGRLKRALSILVPATVVGALLGLPLALGVGPISYTGPQPMDLFLRSLSAGLPLGLTTGCTVKSDKRQRDAPYWHPHLGRCRRSPSPYRPSETPMLFA